MVFFFDIDRTLMDFESAENAGIRAVYDRYRDEIAMDFAEFLRTWKVWAQHFFDLYSAHRLTFDEQRRARLAKMFELNGHAITDADEIERRFTLYWSTYEAEYGLFPDVRPVLETLRSRGVRLGIISNGDGKNQRSKLTRAGIDGMFDPVIISGEIGVSKPDHAIFREALSRAGGIAPLDAVYAGDSIDHDITPSREMCINTIWVNRHTDAVPAVTSGPPLYAEVKNFPDLLSVFEEHLA